MKKGFLTSDDPRCSKIRPPQRQSPKTPDGKYTFDHFELERYLGNGNFSEVFEVTEKGTTNTYALKVFNRSDVMRLNKVADVRMERHAMLRLNEPGHPNVVRLVDTFKDEFRVCFLYQLAEGGELWDHVKFAGILDKQWALTIIAQLVSALEYIHSKNIVHRDLKAENIVLSREGLIKIIDFGSAMDLDHPEVEAPGLGARTPPVAGCLGGGLSRRAIRRPTFQHFVGTPQFMAPEAIKNKDSGKLRDLWSLGCTIYQILTGTPPFGGSTDYFILLRVESGALEFPPDFDPLARDLVERLLVAEPSQRLGAKGFEEIKQHPYFGSCFDLNSNCKSGFNFNYEDKQIKRRLFPPLQELCMRSVLKRFHTLLESAMDRTRQEKYKDDYIKEEKERQQSEQRTHGSCSTEAAGEGKREEEVAAQKRTDSPTGSSSSTNGSSNSTSSSSHSSTSSSSHSSKASSHGGLGEGLLEQLVPLYLLRSARKEESPHLRLLVQRLQYCLESQRQQFNNECRLAEEWDKRHAQKARASETETESEAEEKGAQKAAPQDAKRPTDP